MELNSPEGNGRTVCDWDHVGQGQTGPLESVLHVCVHLGEAFTVDGRNNNVELEQPFYGTSQMSHVAVPNC